MKPPGANVVTLASIWAFSTPGDDAIGYYEYDVSRAQTVLKRILDGQFEGHLVSDFYCGYNAYAGKHQRCWVHLLRALHKLKAEHASEREVVEWVQQVRQTNHHSSRRRRHAVVSQPSGN